jgi:metal-responsive CopG/Arc/MetJ family transcriptional regulator
MRTTLTLDDDVAVALERVREQRGATSLKELVNEALRRGLRDMSSRPKTREPVRTRSVALGRLRIAGVDKIAEALSIAEGETSK